MSSKRPTKRSAIPTPAPKETGRDQVLVLGPTSDGDGQLVLRRREERLEAGKLQQLQEGRPIVGEVVSLKPSGRPNLYDAETIVAPPGPASRPAQVATSKYRKNWDRVFGQKAIGRADPTALPN